MINTSPSHAHLIVKSIKERKQKRSINKSVWQHLSLLLLALFLTGMLSSSTVSQTPQRVYVTNNCGNTVTVIDTATNTIASTISVGNAPYRVAFTPDGTRAYIPN